MKKTISILFALALVLSFSLVTAVPAMATEGTIYVTGTGDVVGGDGTSGNPFASINYAISQASAGDTIIVNVGTYTFATENPSGAYAGMIQITKGITLKAADNVRPILDGSTGVGVIKIHPAALTPGSNVIIEGFEITGNASTGTAITMQGCYDGTPATVIIRDNWIHGMIAGFNAWGASAHLPPGWTSGVAGIQITGNEFYDLGTAGADKVFGVALEGLISWGDAENQYAARVENNEFSNIAVGAELVVGIGLQGGSANAYVGENTFTNVVVGVGVVLADVTTTRIVNNSFTMTDYGVAVMYISNGPVDATHNWWGHASGPSGEGPGSGDSVSASVDFDPWIGKTESVAPVTGGTASFTPSWGVVEDLTAMAAPSLPSVSFPHGMFNFKITGLTPGETVILTVTLPSAVPVGTVWWKYDNGRWHSLPNLNDNGNHIMQLQLTDGGTGDSDSIAGQITDPGGPGNPMTVGWDGSPASKAAVVLPWIALLAAIVAAAGLLVWKRRRVEI